MTTQQPDAFPFRLIVLGTFVPALLFGVAIGIALPLIPLSTTRLGGSLSTAGVVAALMPVGKVLADVPAGMIATRFGDRRAMVGACAVAMLAFVGAALATDLSLLGAASLLLGASNAVFNLARHAYLTVVAPADKRARVLSTLGGMHRIGYFIGPLIGATVILSTSIRGAYWAAAVGALMAAVVTLAVRDPERVAQRASGGEHPRIIDIVRAHRQLFATLGVTVFLVGAVRGARQTVIPLWGDHLGLEASVISVIFSLSGVFDMLLFYPSGKVMDQMGRLWIGVPSMAMMGLAMLAMPWAQTVPQVAVVAAVLGVGNGIGSGIMMTLGSDVAPAADRSAFLGVWRLAQDLGDGAGPLVLAAGAAAGSLAAGIWIAGVAGLAAAGSMQVWTPRYSPHANRTSRRRHGLLEE